MRATSTEVPLLDFQDAEIFARTGRKYAVWCKDHQSLNFARQRGLKPIVHPFADIRDGEVSLAQFEGEYSNTSHTGSRDSDAKPASGDLPNDAIAIIGIGAIMPGALNAATFWNNIVTGVSSISEVPKDRWDPEIYWDEDANAPDKTYSKIGGWIRGFEFDRKLYRMPPSVVEKTDSTQLICLSAVREALDDAGYLDKEFARERCAVILGNSLGGDLRDRTNLRIHYAEIEDMFRRKLNGASPGLLAEMRAEFEAKMPQVNEDAMPGELANVIAGRVAQAFDLQGPNFVVDAACASALAAVENAVKGLRARNFDVAITGGADRTMGPTSFVKFSKIGALSPDGSRPFDTQANGFVMGEGAGIMVLKRLEDAVRDGDKIYATIRGVGGSSDGKGKGITAPNPRGQSLAIERAWADAGLDPRTVSLIEAHGTSTPVGDPSEVQAIRNALDAGSGEWVSDYVALGSVKSQIGHLKSAAGAAGLIKTALALKNRLLPPSINVSEVNPKLELNGSKLRVQTSAQDWEVRDGALRRAGVSAFGFGGTNFHVVLEEYAPEALGGSTFVPGAHFSTNETKMDDVVMNQAFDAGVLTFSANTFEELQSKFQTFEADLRANRARALQGHALDLNQPLSLTPEPFKLAIAFASPEELDERVAKASKAVASNKGWRVLSNQGIFLQESVADGKLAMLFPGQGSQYLMMGQALCERFPVAQRVFDEADRIMMPILGRKLSDIINPDLSKIDAAQAFRDLSQTEVTQPAVLTLNVAILEVLKSMGIQPDIVAGHSLGEYGACVAAGVMSFESALKTVAARGTEMARATPMNGDCGIMASVPASVDEVQAVLKSVDGYVVCANKNCPGQTIIAGLTEPTRIAIQKFRDLGLEVMELPVSHAFHSKVVAAASVPLRKHLEGIAINSPALPILTNVTGGAYPTEPGQIRDLLSEQVAAPVEYIEMIENMYEMGARTFVEVGPKRAQATFVTSILAERAHCSIFTNHPKRGDIGSIMDAIAQIAVHAGSVRVGQESHVNETPQVTKTQIVEIEPRVAALDLRQSPSAQSHSREDIVQKLVQILCEKTGYDADEIEPDFELEADLGIDTVKQAEIMAAAREHYGFDRDDSFRLAEYPSVNHLADYVLEKTQGVNHVDETPQITKTQVVEVEPKVAALDSREDIVEKLVQILCEKTGYDADEIEPDFELEADLGIDTVKQAEIMAAAREHYGFERDDSFRLAEYPSLNHLADYVLEKTRSVHADSVRVGQESQNDELPTSSEPQHIELVSNAPALDSRGQSPRVQSHSREDIVEKLVQILCDKTGYDADEIEADFELEADLGIDTVKQAEIMAAAREHYGFERDDSFRLAEYPSLNHLADYVLEKTQVVHEGSVQESQVTESPQIAKTQVVEVESTPVALDSRGQSPRALHQHEVQSDVVISGVALGLPGQNEMFADNSIDDLLKGQNFIQSVDRDVRERIVSKRIVRLVKHDGGGGEMEEVTDPDTVIRLAGKPAKFEIEEWGLPERLVESLDDTSQMAMAAGLAALKDAGLPLVPRYRTTTNGKKVTVGWTLPDEVAAETGVIFASAFAGQDALIDEVQASHQPGYQFNHRYLLRVLGIANSRFAEFIGARGPNTKINNACASTTTAIAMAEDWIRLGRCKRVVIMGADNASGDTLFEWIGAGFLATGAASTKENVEDAALPFDRRRDGMIIGMGCVALVVEASGLPEARGIEPLADVLGTRFVNSALHPTRLDVDHIATEVNAMMQHIESRYRVDRKEIAAKTVFVSHETYTPARGGSADAEISSLRQTFGDAADQVVIANTKGFTGHAMGAGIEDVLAVKALQREELPHIANFKEPDPNLGNLRLSQGGKYQLDYALRLAAGFGSQLALAFLRFRARDENRVFSPAQQRAWLEEVTGFENPVLEVSQKTLRVRDADPAPKSPAPLEPQTPAHTPAPAPMVSAPEPAPAQAKISPRLVIAAANTAPGVDHEALRTLLSGKHVGVIAGPMILSDMMVRALETLGARPTLIQHTRSPLDDAGLNLDFTDEAAVEREFSQQRFDGLVNLIGFGREELDADETWRAAISSFVAARTWAKLGHHEGGFFLSVTGMGGRLGFARAHGPLVTSGAVAGLTKSLAREWEKTTVRLVDVAREGFYPTLGEQVLAALLGDHVELGILGGVHWVPTTISVEDASHGTPRSRMPKEGAAIIATGGARGITAKIVLDIAKRVRGNHFVLVGRSEFLGEHVLKISADEVKAGARAKLEAKGVRVTPLEVKKEVSRHLAQQEIATTLMEIRALGSSAEYVACDMANGAAIAKMVRQISQPIDLVIHGAGIEESRYLIEKTTDDFARVFRGKALGAIALWRAVEHQNPSAFVVFSSVAGRFGNVGQADYSAANEVLNKLTAHIQSTSSTAALSFDWTAWDDVGMATEGSMKDILLARGVQMLAPEVGAPMVADILSAGLSGEFLVAGALGDMAPASAVVTFERNELPLAARVDERTSQKVVVSRTFSIDDRFMRDHTYQGSSILPGVMGYEMMFEAAKLLIGRAPEGAQNVRFDKAIKLLRDEPVAVKAVAERAPGKIVCRVESSRKTVTGRELNEVHFTAEFLEHSAARPSFVCSSEDLMEGPDHREIYERYFHTGVFRVLDSAAYVGPNVVIAQGRVPAETWLEGATNTAFESEPMLREMAFQTIGIWGMIHTKKSYLPLAIRENYHAGSAAPSSAVRIRAVHRETTEHSIIFDAEVRDEFGKLLLQLDGVELVAHQSLRDDECFEELKPSTMTILRATLPEAQAWLDDHGIAHDDFLTAQEREAFDRFLSDRRKSEWLSARVASKRLVATYLQDFYGIEANPGDIVIDKDVHKAPVVALRGSLGRLDLPLPDLTITHSGGVAYAAITPEPKVRIGIDLETIEPREDSFAQTYFSAQELQEMPELDSQVRLAALWTCKEAVSKALGVGLHLNVMDIQLSEFKPSGNGYSARVTLHRETAAQFPHVGAAQFEVGFEVVDRYVFAKARLEDAPERENTVQASSKETKKESEVDTEILAAVAALLFHKGLLTGTQSQDHSSERRS
ncbi:type I polyketide synthase [Microvenator marinus]|nr:type I polyketide synthase [Microvenator marinus]